ncbi:hypothetical protein TKK_0001111 [Trichogramma kaykai]|uniref:Origin recognition complex subunit 2 n=1 Tax=Trichogramma kaykai TaxID=54128 RepID=A0ABD2WSE9_9HYME
MKGTRQSGRLVNKPAANYYVTQKKTKVVKQKNCNGVEGEEEFKKIEPITKRDLEDFDDDVDGRGLYSLAITEPAKKKVTATGNAKEIRNKATSVLPPLMEVSVKIEPLKLKCHDENWEVMPNDNKENKESKTDPSLKRVLRRGRSRANVYHMSTDDYFARQSEKSVTSNHTLSKLKKRRLDEEELQKLLANNNHISETQQDIINALYDCAQKYYPEWFRLMEEGFTVLLYGLGSKRLLINQFHKEMISDEPTLIINGFFPNLTIKEILDNIIVELLGKQTDTNQGECFEIIEKTMKRHSSDRIYLLIHNLDGGMLRNSKAQDILSRLAAIPNIHVMASVDHINAPLIWDNVKRSRYNFFWVDATTFKPYEAETSYESSLLVQKSGALALLSLQNVFMSLTSNAKAIYILLVKYQLQHGGANYAGMAFKDLFNAARQAFLVNSDQSLRTQLTEFLDHKLVKTKRTSDGVEALVIPLDDGLLKQFLEQYDTGS